ncbi:chloride channel protein [Streptococcus ictaluri]|uniref:Chloride transporter, ClC family n=1 Tax=Streptococcus ictaluri 707-05 TaxID=764299 RepID=G5K0E1_9STRE|nr:chloride channel protein [Streptococcus ictaluri]EHI70618.1 chloride transporter, ClC family [Streptococcus ictaluri 707-05]
MLSPIKTLKEISFQDKVLLAFLALPIGLVIGAIDFMFGQGLLDLSAYRDNHVTYLLPFLPLAGLIITFLYQRFGKEAAKGMGLVFDVGHGKKKRIPLILIPLIIVTTWLTHLFGASAGREGVAVQIGATVSHYVKRFTGLKEHSHTFLVMGMAAGFAGLFQTPMTGVVFALEVLLLGQLSYSALVPSLIAAYTASWTSHALGLEKFSVTLGTQLSLNLISFVKLIILGILFGIVGNAFAYFLSKVKAGLTEKFSNPYQRIFVISLILSLALLLSYQGRYSGLGTNLIHQAFSQGDIYAYDWVLKLMFTVLTLSAGFQGGEVTPLFSIGVSFGFILAPLVGLPSSLVAALGYASVFGSATNTFLAPIFIGLEVFGPQNSFAFFIVSAIAYRVSRKHSIYSNQQFLSLRF